MQSLARQLWHNKAQQASRESQLQQDSPLTLCPSDRTSQLPLSRRRGRLTANMLRSGASRSLLRSLTTAGSAGAKVTSSPIHQQLRSQLCTLSSRTSALSTIKPLAPRTLAQIRFASTSDRKPVDHVDAQHETELGKEKLEAHPELVSSTSSAHAINSELGAADPREEDDTDMMAGIRGDLVCYGLYGR